MEHMQPSTINHHMQSMQQAWEEEDNFRNGLPVSLIVAAGVGSETNSILYTPTSPETTNHGKGTSNI
jgi:hypothetical protein